MTTNLSGSGTATIEYPVFVALPVARVSLIEREDMWDAIVRGEAFIKLFTGFDVWDEHNLPCLSKKRATSIWGIFEGEWEAESMQES